MNELMAQMAERIAKKIRVAKIYLGSHENKRNCPFYSEWKGMEQTLDTLGIPYTYEYDDSLEITAVIVAGNRAEVGGR